MALVVGTRCGAYEITGRIGAGGMGEVFRATDTKLGREVAIKTLPSALAQEPDRLARFEREAKLLATLNHANIAAIYGLDEHEGTQFLSMELIEGETLEQKLKVGALPVEDALQLALQIAAALEAAHEKGVVHRDLKPANIMITPNGVVKVLDFGLAKAFSGDPNQATPAHSPALSLAMTQQGLVLGTAAYMSPEQASGQATDQRADIWAFGVVLYEMLTGLPLFGGESVPHILADVLRTEPDWSRLPENLHPRLRLVLERCLSKKLRDRYHSIADARIEIEDALRNPQSAVAAPQIAEPVKRRIWPVAAAFLIGLLAAGLTVWAVMRPGIGDVARFDVTPDDGLTVLLNSPSVAISPDGQSIAYLVGGDFRGGTGLRLRRLSQLESTALITDSEGTVASPFFSPDGLQIGFYTFVSGENILKRVSIQGGPSSTIANIPGNLRGASWGTDGTIVFGTGDASSGLWRVRAAGGEPELLTTPDTANGALNHMWPEFLPGDESVLFTIVGDSEESSQVAVLSLATGEVRVLVQGGSSPHYSPTGHLLYSRAGTMFAVGFDADKLEVRGDATPVQEGVLSKGAEGVTEAALDTKGTLLYLNGTQVEQGARRLVWVDAEGRETFAPTPARAYDQLVLSPDETRAALVIQGDAAIWIADLARGTLQRLGADLGAGEPTVLFFSADGQRVASTANRDGQLGVIWQPVDGANRTESLVKLDASVAAVLAGELTPDGEQYVLSVIKNNNRDIGVGLIGDPSSYQDVLATPAAEIAPAISPDGQWIAYSSNETGDFEEYLQRFPDGGGLVPVSIGGAAIQHWSADGRSLSYLRISATNVANALTMMRAPVMGLDPPGGSPELGTATELFPFSYYFPVNAKSHFDMTADGGRFLAITGGAEGNANTRLILVQNWTEELRRLVPSD